MNTKILYLLLLFLTHFQGFAQRQHITGHIYAGTVPLENVNLKIPSLRKEFKTDQNGFFKVDSLSAGSYELDFSLVGHQNLKQKVEVKDKAIILQLSMIVLESNLNDVVVTGVSKATSLRKSPIPLAVISKKSMDQQVSTNLIDAIVRGIPGVNAVTTGPNVSKPFIRGLGYNRVLTLYDGLRQEGQQWGDEHGIEVDEYSIGRVEVVKGPASLTYGSDAIAGVINMIPQFSALNDGQLSGEYIANYQTNHGALASSIGLGYAKQDWNYMIRMSGKTAHNYYSPVDGYVYGTGFREYNLLASARVDRKWGYSKTAITYYNSLMEIPDGSRDSLSRKFTRQILDFGDDITSRPIVNGDELNAYSINPLHQHIQHFRLYNNSAFKIGNQDLNVLIGAQKSVRREYNHPTLPEQAGLFVVLNTLNYDLKYNFPDLNGWESTIGINGMFQSNRSKAATDFPIPDYNLFDLGTYYFAKKTMGPVDVSGGLRFDRRNMHWSDFYVGTSAQTGFGKHVLSAVDGAELQFPAFQKNYYGLSGSLGLTYNLSEKFLIKGNLSRGYRAPNITEIGSNGLDPGAHIVYLGNRNFRPEFNFQQDFALIAYLKDLELSLEVFNNGIQNYIYQSRLTDANGDPVILVPGNLTYQYQQSKARLYGGEISLNIHPSTAQWLTLNNSLAYVLGLNKNEELLNKFGDQAKYLPFIPPLQIRTSLTATIKGNKIFDKPYFKIDAGIFGRQDKFYALDDTESYTAGYALLNMGMGTALKSNTGRMFMEIFIQCDNLFNRVYQSNMSRLKYFEYYPDSPNGRSGIYNMGRNISVKVRVPF